MARRILLPLIVALLLPVAASAQKKPLDHDAYARWRAISDTRLSADGSWAVWREAPDTVGNGEVVIRTTAGSTTHRIPLGDDARFTPDGTHVVAIVRAPYEATRLASKVEYKAVFDSLEAQYKSADKAWNKGKGDAEAAISAFEPVISNARELASDLGNLTPVRTGGEMVVDQTDIGPERRLSLLGSFFVKGSDFRKGLVGSLPQGRAD